MKWDVMSKLMYHLLVMWLRSKFGRSEVEPYAVKHICFGFFALLFFISLQKKKKTKGLEKLW